MLKKTTPLLLMEMERPFDYMKEGYVAKELLRVPALALLLNVSYTAQLVYALLYTKVVTERHVDGEGHCYVEMTVAQMAKHLIELEPPIRRALRELEEMYGDSSVTGLKLGMRATGAG